MIVIKNNSIEVILDAGKSFVCLLLAKSHLEVTGEHSL